MATIVIVLAVVAVLLVGLFVGGLVANRRHYRTRGGAYSRHVAEADRALEQARAADRGWDREVLESAARLALAEQRPDSSYEGLHLVLVDDQPGVEEDRAELVAVGPDGNAKLSLARRDPEGWVVEAIE